MHLRRFHCSLLRKMIKFTQSFYLLKKNKKQAKDIFFNKLPLSRFESKAGLECIHGLGCTFCTSVIPVHNTLHKLLVFGKNGICKEAVSWVRGMCILLHPLILPQCQLGHRLFFTHTYTWLKIFQSQPWDWSLNETTFERPGFSGHALHIMTLILDG